MSEFSFLSEIKIFSFAFAPKNWAMCNGQLLPINQNTPIFALIGTFYGGNGQTNFALPDLRGRIPMHWGTVQTLGQSGGEDEHSLIKQEMPAHTHFLNSSNNVADQSSPGNNFWANGSSAAAFHTAANSNMSPSAISVVGGGQPHENRSPYLVLNFCIALQGIFPSRS